ncbi:thiazolylpeptide-type bacteriocin [Corynebacterium diphtheriae]|nr:thiazolylpeptide-type bacteriocin [Corynebacterium diphtheriae]CAB0857251.1 thiazolylpeptide-type bacteriocin [Corynebacterium diphtheriae]CAB0857828.1 thiazolylpeptide-type bacteriocin [Corynebacterium diphtheriae]
MTSMHRDAMSGLNLDLLAMEVEGLEVNDYADADDTAFFSMCSSTTSSSSCISTSSS